MSISADTKPDLQQFVDFAGKNDVSVPANGAVSLPDARSVMEFYFTPPPANATLLGDRFLCPGGALLVVGPSGVGKSSASVQQDAYWALGRAAFGIQPSRPLKILIIQAENDDGDLHEMAKGVLDGVFDMDLDRDEKYALETNCVFVTVNDKTGLDFLALLDALLEEHKPDVFRLDPLSAYLGCDPVDTGRLSAFLRAGLNPLLAKHQCAAIINHHTPKITNRDTTKWSTLDFSYAAAGGAELTNWARAVIVINPTSDPRVFEFIAAKRGARIGWREPSGEPILRRMFAHTRRDGAILWEEPDEAAIRSARKKKAAYDIDKLILEAVPSAAAIEKEVLIRHVNDQGPGIGSIKSALRTLLHAEPPVLHEWLEPRSRTNPRRSIARRPQATCAGESGATVTRMT